MSLIHRSASESSSPSSQAAAPGLTLRLLGEVRPVWQGRPLGLTAPRLLRLLAYLHLHGPASREELACIFWPGRGAAHVRQALYTLRGLPGAEEWLIDGPTVTVHARSDLNEVWHHLGRQDHGPALELLRPRTPLLGGLFSGASAEFEDWLEGQQAALDRAYLSALLAHAQALEGGGERDQAHDYLRRALDLDPLDERPYRALMTLESAAGRVAEALEVFETCRLTLRRELDAEPQPETLALLRDLEAESGGISGNHSRARVVGAADLPFVASGPLCGRKEDLEAVTAQLLTQNRALIQGLAGMGKSRLAWAMVAQMLEEDEASRALWLELNADASEVLLRALLDGLGLRNPAPDAAAIATALNEHHIRLIVLDNAASSYALHSLLAHLPPTVTVLVTSRQRLPRLPRVSLHRLARADSMALVQAYLEEGKENQEDADLPPPDSYTLDALCAVLGDHPYALRLAALTLGQQSAPGARELLAALSLAPLSLAPDAHGEGQSVAALIEQSLALLDAPAYEAYLGLGSLFAPQTTPELLALALRRDAADTETALYSLTDHGLTTRDTRSGSETVVYRMHELTWHEARAHRALHPHAVLKATRDFAAQYTQTPDLLNHEVPNLLGAAGLAHRQHPAELPALFCGWLRGPYIGARGFPTAHLPLLAEAVRVAEEAEDWEKAGVLSGKLGDVQQALLGDQHAAIDQYLKAASYAERVGLAAKQATALAIAGVLQALNHLPEADSTLEDAAHIAQQSGDALIQGRVLEKQGVAHAMRQNFTAARDSLQAARETLRPLLAPQHPQLQEARATLINVTSNLGQAHQRLRELDTALALKREALDLARESDEQFAAASRLADIGEVLGLMERFEESRAALQEATGYFRELGATAQESAARNLLNALPQPA
ncbi:BTAD domain-containing putative transcriptional regulator [Deinococcus frigens]|uniref:AfsR/SARP family transcriptional regulator n=1 Tax=Deinococcus frigens TaxID=249403 RepID=UPI000A02AEFE|nr:BTAD domain-containing putative transcriptional regulator [Deinococcus frigens]